MRVMVAHIGIAKSGRYQYRRRVPQELKAALGKSELVVSLKTKNREAALREHAKVHAEVERRIATLSSSAPELAEYQETIRLLRDAKIIRRGADRADSFRDADMEQRQAFGDFVVKRVGSMSDEEAHKPLSEAPTNFKRVLRAMQTGVEKPELRLRDALNLYLKEKSDEYNETRQRQDSERVVKALGSKSNQGIEMAL